MNNKIDSYFHCKQCLLERPKDQSPAEWARLSVGSTPKGFQRKAFKYGAGVIKSMFWQSIYAGRKLLTMMTEPQEKP